MSVGHFSWRRLHHCTHLHVGHVFGHHGGLPTFDAFMLERSADLQPRSYQEVGPPIKSHKAADILQGVPHLGVARAADRLLARSGGSPADPNVVDSYPSAIPDARVGVAHIELDEPSDVRSAASSPLCFIASSANAKASDVSGLR